MSRATKPTLQQKSPRKCVGFFVARAFGIKALNIQRQRRRQISIFVPNSTTRLAGILKKSVGFAAF